MRQATTIEKLYLDFDGFFASVMQQAMPKLRGRPDETDATIPRERWGQNWLIRGVIAQARLRKAGVKRMPSIPGDVYMFSPLPVSSQKAILENAPAEERAKYLPHANSPLRTHTAAAR